MSVLWRSWRSQTNGEHQAGPATGRSLGVRNGGPSHYRPADRLRVGQMVQVREEFTLDRARVGFTWSQPVPPTCAAVADDVQESRPIGPRATTPGGGLTFHVPALRPGVHAHEYFLAAVRPGACVLPDPVLRIGETRVPVTVEPEEVRPIVLGGE